MKQSIEAYIPSVSYSNGTTLHSFIGNDPFVAQSVVFPGVLLAAWMVNFCAHSKGYITVFYYYLGVFTITTQTLSRTGMLKLSPFLCKVLHSSMVFGSVN